MTIADQIWNRAAREHGCAETRAGDRALAALLLVHGLVMNGGVHHAIESIEATELSSGADGYEYFGLHDVAAFLRGASEDAALSEWTEGSEITANRRYKKLVPSDSYIEARFLEVLHMQPHEFAPTGSD